MPSLVSNFAGLEFRSRYENTDTKKEELNFHSEVHEVKKIIRIVEDSRESHNFHGGSGILMRKQSLVIYL